VPRRTNLTPAVMADDDLPPVPAPVRELEEIDPGLLPQVNELRAAAERDQRGAAIAAATGSSPRCW